MMFANVVYCKGAITRLQVGTRKEIHVIIRVILDSMCNVYTRTILRRITESESDLPSVTMFAKLVCYKCDRIHLQVGTD